MRMVIHHLTSFRSAYWPAAHLCRFYRMPSLVCASAAASRHNLAAAATDDSLASCQSANHQASSSCNEQQRAAPSVAQACCTGASISVDISRTFYLVNPSGDLTSTQRQFEQTLAGQRGWQVGLCNKGTLISYLHTMVLSGVCVGCPASGQHI